MRLTLITLQLRCKNSTEIVRFGDTLTFVHGEMSTGKSSIAALVDFCLGGNLRRTPAVRSEVVSVTLECEIGSTVAVLTRNPAADTHVVASLRREDSSLQEYIVPIRPGAELIEAPDVYCLSDLLLRLLGIGRIRVRKRSDDPNSDMVRLSFRDIFEFCYLDQDHLDSDFFLLEQPIRKEKSQDSLRFFLGALSERLLTLQSELSDVRARQRAHRDAAEEIRQFLKRFDFESTERVDQEIATLIEEAKELGQTIGKLEVDYSPERHITQEDQNTILRLNNEITATRSSIADVQARIVDQESLRAELIAMKFKLARVDRAHELLDRVTFKSCPCCGTPVKPAPADTCNLCGSPKHQVAPERGDVAEMAEDISSRVQDLEYSIKQHKRSLAKSETELRRQESKFIQLDREVSRTVRQYESDYAARTRKYVRRIATIEERLQSLKKNRELPARVVEMLAESDAMSSDIERLQREISFEQEALEAVETKFVSLERNYKQILLRIGFPGIREADQVHVDRRTMIPEIRQDLTQEGWTFYDAGSGGKKTMLKVCFALALHVTAAQHELLVPRILIIDSPMKNITPDINREIFSAFYRAVFGYLRNELRAWQAVLIDQTYVDPTQYDVPHIALMLMRNDKDHPPLIGSYSGP